MTLVKHAGAPIWFQDPLKTLKIVLAGTCAWTYAHLEPHSFVESRVPYLVVLGVSS